MVILASQSPRRQELLRETGLEFRVVAPQVEEQLPVGKVQRPDLLVRRLALAKAKEVSARVSGLVLAADTVVVCGGSVLGKPADAEEAGVMLRALSGRWHSVYTGVALLEGETLQIGCERTRVAFRELTESDLDRYLATREPFDKAGAYAIQGKGAALIREVRGCYTNVIGLPVPKVLAMLVQHAQQPRVTKT
jgi:septum formation protein